MDEQARQEAAKRQLAKDLRKIKKLKRMEDDGAGMSLNSMMDMMTIILVFLLKSFGSEALQIDSGTTHVPFSTTEMKPKAMTTVTITGDMILVNQDKAVKLNARVVDAKDKKAGPTSMIITPLEDLLKKDIHIRQTQFKGDSSVSFKGELTIIADSGTPYRLIAEVIQTAIINDFKKFRFAVYNNNANLALSGTIQSSK